MDILYMSLFCLLVTFVLSSLHFLFHKSKPGAGLPPGRTGWPVIGESLEFFSTGRKGHAEKFIFDRMAKYSPIVFRTHLLGNKFLFSNENKLVQSWWPSSVEKIFPSSIRISYKEESIKMRKMLPNFLKAEALHRYIGIMDHIARHHFAEGWDNKKEVVVFPLAKNYTFRVAFRLFVSIEDPNQLDKFAKPFNLLAAGVISIPIDLPGTPFNKGIKASNFVRKELVAIIKQRKLDLADGKASPSQDILSHMLLTSDDTQELDIANSILALLIGSHDTSSSVCTSIVKYLAELPHIYDRVYNGKQNLTPSVSEKYEYLVRHGF